MTPEEAEREFLEFIEKERQQIVLDRHTSRLETLLNAEYDSPALLTALQWKNVLGLDDLVTKP